MSTDPNVHSGPQWNRYGGLKGTQFKHLKNLPVAALDESLPSDALLCLKPQGRYVLFLVKKATLTDVDVDLGRWAWSNDNPTYGLDAYISDTVDAGVTAAYTLYKLETYNMPVGCFITGHTGSAGSVDVYYKWLSE